VLKKNRELAKEKLEIAYYNKSCEYTLRAALYLGILHMDSPEKLDKKKGYEWIKIAADNGNGAPEAMKMLARMYKRGIGVEPDTEESEKWQSLYDKKKLPNDEEDDEEDDENGIPSPSRAEAEEQQRQMMMGQGGPKKFVWDRWAVLRVFVGFGMMSFYFVVSGGYGITRAQFKR